MKLTITGDIMCEPAILKAGKKKDGTYDFSFVFENAKRLWEDSDYVIGNLEFPIAEDMPLTTAMDVFNAPLSYGKNAKEAGLDLVSVVNNHTLDRTWEGALKTLKNLKACGLPTVGVSASPEERQEAYYAMVDGVKVAVIAYTYTTNCKLPPELADKEELINYLRSPRALTYLPEIQPRFRSWVDNAFPKLDKKIRRKINSFLHIPKPFDRADDEAKEENYASYLARLTEDIKKAKEKADFVLFYPHVGGQFNEEPGVFSRIVFDTAIKAGADAVLASHSHIIQKAEWIGKVPCAWCMGNYNMDSTSSIVVRKNHPEIGFLTHLYFDGKELEKVTYSVTKAVWEKGKYRTYPMKDLYEKAKSEKEKATLRAELAHTLLRITGKTVENPEFRDEYVL